MNNIKFKFQQPKAIEAILYLANKMPASESDIYSICKRLYSADKFSLEKYGRFISGETYYAMENGATPSCSYDLLKEASQSPVEGISVKVNQVIATRKPDLDYLSESDMECLEQAANLEREYSVQQAHDDAYQKSWKRRGSGKRALMPVESIAESFENSDDLIAYLSQH